MTEFIIDDSGAEMRLDRFVRRETPGLTQAMVQKLLRTGKIRLNGAKVEANARLTPGDTLLVPEIAPPEKKPRERQVMALDANGQKELEAMVIYKDDSVIVLNKPAGLAVQGGSGITKHIDGMLDFLRYGAEERPRLVHRIDRDTSGCLLLARTSRLAANLTERFRNRNVEKVYWALLAGVPDPAEGRVDMALKRVEVSGTSRAEPAGRKDPDGQKAVSDYRVLDKAGRLFCLAELRPQTGRMHQLRAHCLAMGTPILGDAAYGGILNEHFAPQLHLHARRLSFPHPEGGFLTVEAELPKHMRDGFVYLGFDAPAAQKPRRH